MPKLLPTLAVFFCLVALIRAEDEEDSLEKPSVYYFNTVTGESVWDRPEELGWISEEEEHEGATYWVVNGESTWEKPAEFDWREGFDKDENRYFYYNPEEGKFVWDKPASIAWVVVDSVTNEEL